jgi:uncharacterized sporulation protein YeaH/YhbH (DUF444 family)
MLDAKEPWGQGAASRSPVSPVRVWASPPAFPGSPIERDRARYTDLVGEAIRRELPHIVARAPVMTSPDGQLVAIPVPFLDLPHFRRASPRDPRPRGGVGHGPGKPGDVIARMPRRVGRTGSAGGDEGRHVLVWVDRQSLQELVFQDLNLPRLDPKRRGRLASDAPRWTSRRDRGPQSRLDRAATIRAALVRRLVTGLDQPPLLSQDLKFVSWRERERPVTQAVVGLLRDMSGSMDGDKMYLAHAVSWWLVSWLQSRYQHVELDFWLHDTRGWRVDEAEFFGTGPGGGTRAATAYQAIAGSWTTTYPVDDWNWYLFHFTDGDDYDPEAARRVVAGEFVPRVALLGLVQLTRSGELSRLAKAYRQLPDPPVRTVLLRSREDVARTLTHLLREGGSEDGERQRLG